MRPVEPGGRLEPKFQLDPPSVEVRTVSPLPLLRPIAIQDVVFGHDIEGIEAIVGW